ncbi:MAG: hypothetical protein HY286_15915 [Planctomycetes bacterium]|nr:hypothetical protein [Planctomycetota bacterium]
MDVLQKPFLSIALATAAFCCIGSGDSTGAAAQSESAPASRESLSSGDAISLTSRPSRAASGGADGQVFRAAFPFRAPGNSRGLITIDAELPIGQPAQPTAERGWTIDVNGERAEAGSLNIMNLDRRSALALGRAEMQRSELLRWFVYLERGKRADSGAASRPMTTERIGSVFPIGDDGSRFDAYYVRDARVASEALLSGNGLSIAGAGDRPRRFMRGHRFEAGNGIVASVRFADANGGSIRISVGLPDNKPGRIALPAKGVSVAITELSPDLSVGRVAERVSGNVAFSTRGAGDAILHLELDVALRQVGGHEPQRLLVRGDFPVVPVLLEELTPWLGKFNIGRPVLETFAFPQAADEPETQNY